ncbi:MAG: Fic family protein [Candidatus Beckwithbacteria bacterium]|nr:Fic family protein [Candidatus Beckwithbacteria bacterium]
MKQLLQELEALRFAFKLIKPPAVVVENIRRESLLKSSLYSAKIEGNQLSYETIKTNLNNKTKAKLEVFNLLTAYKYVYSKKAQKKISLSLIKDLHLKTMKNLMPHPGEFRHEASAIFNQAGVAIYLTPPPTEIIDRLNRLIKQLNQSPEQTLIKAVMTHFWFEKIHPFIDGNGRVGRLLTAAIMNQGGFGFNGLVSIEEAINDKKDVYYQALNETKNYQHLTEFLLNLYLEQGKKVFTKLTQPQTEEESTLPLRRQEILNILKDHPYASFDFIQRRFLSINPKTLHYDLKKLQEQKLVIKIGSTRGAVYQLIFR